MSMLGRELAHALGVKGLSEVAIPERGKARPVGEAHSATVATAQEFEFKIPTDRLVHAVVMSIGESTTASGEQGTLADDITDIDLNTNLGHLKEMTGTMCKQLGIINKEKDPTGVYTLYFTDPHIPEAKPLPAWIFSSIILKVKDNAPAGGNYHHIYVSVIESEVPEGLSVKDFRILQERYLRWEKYGTNTGWQRYEHERAFKVFGFLYAMDDNGTLSDTAFDKIKMYGLKPSGEHLMLDELWISHLKMANQKAYMNALDTGFFYLEYTQGYDSGQYTTLRTMLNIPSAGTNVGVRVLERTVV